MEPMAIERILAKRLELDGYVTSLRVPFAHTKGHGDIDVLAIKPRPFHVVVGECKAWGSPEDYRTYHRRDADWMREFLDDLRNNYRKLFIPGVTNTLGLLQRDPVSYWLVVPGAIDHSLKDVIDGWPSTYRVIAIHQLLRELIFCVQRDSLQRRKRYSDTASELIRWLMRAHNNGHLDFSEFQVDLQRAAQSNPAVYDPYVRNYVRAIVRAVLVRTHGLDTRRKAIIGLLKLASKGGAEFGIAQIESKLANLKITTKANQVRVGLTTWQRLGIVVSRRDGKRDLYSIPAPFARELRFCLRDQRIN